MSRPEDSWKSYRETVYKSAVPLITMQERECSLAFYSGMMAAFNMVVDIANAASDEDRGADELEKFQQEIDSAARRSNLDRNDGRS